MKNLRSTSMIGSVHFGNGLESDRKVIGLRSTLKIALKSGLAVIILKLLP